MMNEDVFSLIIWGGLWFAWIFLLALSAMRLTKLPDVLYPTYGKKVVRNGNKYLRSRSFYSSDDKTIFWKVCFLDDGSVWLLTYGKSNDKDVLKTIVRRIM